MKQWESSNGIYFTNGSIASVAESHIEGMVGRAWIDSMAAVALWTGFILSGRPL